LQPKIPLNKSVSYVLVSFDIVRTLNCLTMSLRYCIFFDHTEN
jgi:hypothetical protein